MNDTTRSDKKKSNATHDTATTKRHKHQSLDNDKQEHESDSGNDIKKPFSDITMPGLIGGSLAAVTSTLLVQKIGIAGTIIGIIISYFASTVSGSLYKWILKKPIKKLKEKISKPELAQSPFPSRSSINHDTVPTNEDDAKNTPIHSADAPEHKKATPKEASNKTARYDNRNYHNTREPSSLNEFLENHDNNVLNASHKRRSKSHALLAAIAFSLAFSLACLLVFVGIINRATNGNGLGHVPSAIIRPNDKIINDSSNEREEQATLDKINAAVAADSNEPSSNHDSKAPVIEDNDDTNNNQENPTEASPTESSSSLTLKATPESQENETARSGISSSSGLLTSEESPDNTRHDNTHDHSNKNNPSNDSSSSSREDNHHDDSVPSSNLATGTQSHGLESE